jgi:hypothetical protein
MFAFTTPIDPAGRATRGRLSLPNHASEADERAVVRLRPDWPAVLSLARFARRATWLFGNAGAVVECVDQAPRSCAALRPSGDATSIRLNFAGWATTLIRPERRARHVEFFDACGAALAAVRLEECDAGIDQFIWLLADDDAVKAPTRTRPLRSNRSVAATLRVHALAMALRLGIDSGIRLRLRLENAGGSVAWSPAKLSLGDEGDFLELRSPFGRMHIDPSAGPAWMIDLHADDGVGPALELHSSTDGGSIRIDAGDDLDRAAWRSLCRYVVSEAASSSPVLWRTRA